MRTLHVYLARELLRTFLMTSLVLTLLVVMGGGVANIFRSEGIAAEDLAKIFAFLTPVAVTLILPVAALFSAAITYGRAAADNEINACRAAGINIHRLLLSAFLLALAITTLTYLSWNFLIPGLSHQIEETGKRELHTVVMTQFQKAKPLAFGKYRMMANRCEELDPRRVLEQPTPGHKYLLLTGVSFMEIDDQEPSRFGTADATVIDFDRSQGAPRVTADLQGVRLFDVSHRQYYDLAHQLLPPMEIPTALRRKTKFDDLFALLEYLERPEASPDIEDRLAGLTREWMIVTLNRSVADALRRTGQFVLAGPGLRYEIAVKQYAEDPEDGKLSLRGIRVAETGSAGNRILTADSATMELRSSADRSKPIILVDLIGKVELGAQASGLGGRIVRKPRETLQPVNFFDQPDLKAKFGAFNVHSLLVDDGTRTLPRKQAKVRDKLLQRLSQYHFEIIGEINFRASYALSTIGVVLLGAILGIVVRGGQVLTAFGISCVPSLIVVVCAMVGRNLSDRPNMATLSLSVMWGSAAFIYLAAAFFAVKVLKR